MRRNRSYARPRAIWLFALLPVSALVFCFILPYASALTAGFPASLLRGGAAQGSGVLPSALLSPSLHSITLFTVKQALQSALAAVLLGLPGAWLLGTALEDSNTAWKRHLAAAIRSLTGIPFAMPPILVVLGFVIFFGNNGWANRLFMLISGKEEGPIRILYRPSAIILAHGFYNFPLVIRLVADGIAGARRTYGRAAASLGANPLAAAFTVLIPLCFPSLIAAALLVFLYSFTSFAVVLVLGGGPAVTTLAVEIYRYARLSLDLRNAGALALVETAVALTAFAAYVFFDRKSRAMVPQDLQERPQEQKSSPASYAVIVIYCLILAVFVLGPLLSIPAESLLSRQTRSAASALSLRHWLTLGEWVIPALGRSLLLAVLSATLASFLAALAASAVRVAGTGSLPGTVIHFAAVAPLASSGIVLGLGWLALYGRDHSRSLFAVVILHAVSALPFAFNSLSQGLRGVPANTANAAMVFGANLPLRIITVEIPLSLGRLRSAWAFSAVISLGELNAILMVGLDEWETLPLLIYRAAGAYRYGSACAAGTLLILSCAAVFLLSEIRTGRGVSRRKTHPRGKGQ